MERDERDEAIRAMVRERYAATAREAADGGDVSCGGGSCCGPAPVRTRDVDGLEVFGGSLYGDGEAEGAPAGALAASLGCGVPTEAARLEPGETVLDLGSGAGADVLIAAARVGSSGRAIGVDMTPEMLALARANAAEAGAANAEFVEGRLERLPLADDAVDVVISNCVVNLSPDKRAVLVEAARVVRPGGRVAISDVIADDAMDAATRSDPELWSGCVAGALTRSEMRDALEAAGFVDVAIEEGAPVHRHARSAMVTARLPA